MKSFALLVAVFMMGTVLIGSGEGVPPATRESLGDCPVCMDPVGSDGVLLHIAQASDSEKAGVPHSMHYACTQRAITSASEALNRITFVGELGCHYLKCPNCRTWIRLTQDGEHYTGAVITNNSITRSLDDALRGVIAIALPSEVRRDTVSLSRYRAYIKPGMMCIILIIAGIVIWICGPARCSAH